MNIDVLYAYFEGETTNNWSHNHSDAITRLRYCLAIIIMIDHAQNVGAR